MLIILTDVFLPEGSGSVRGGGGGNAREYKIKKTKKKGRKDNLGQLYKWILFNHKNGE